MKNIYLSLIIAASFVLSVQAQVEVTIDGNAEYIGFANVFETDANGGAFVFGDFWGVPDLKSTISASENTVTLQPNFNTYADNPTDPFWVDQTTGEGNKVFEGNTFIENADLAGEEITFTGTVSSNTLDAAYEAMAFIKVFNEDFSVLKIEEAPLVEGEDFVIEYTNVEAADAVVQYGFYVKGVNANPDDEDALGSIVIGPNTLSLNDASNVDLAIYPNPTVNRWILTSNSAVTSVLVYDISGKQVIALQPDSNEVSIETGNLRAGVYVATITTEQGSITKKLIKK